MISCIRQFNDPDNAVINQGFFYLEDPKLDQSEKFANNTPTGRVSASVNDAAGLLIPATTYSYYIEVCDGDPTGRNNDGVLTSQVVGGGDNAVRLTWDVVQGAAYYRIFGRTAGNGLLAIVYQPDFNQPIPGGTTATWTDLGTVTPGAGPVFGNTTFGGMKLYKMTLAVPNDPSFGYNAPTILAKFPRRYGITASGGVLGSCQWSPQMLQFAGFLVIMLGNGYRPQYSDGTTVFPFSNTFTAQYAVWLTGVVYLTGDIIQPTPANGHIYKCIQGGLSGAVMPAFPTVTSQTVVDNQVVWQEMGPVTLSPAPRGGAHASYHAGALWVFNTQPTNSSDLQDGPSMLAMCDVNNITSWNPLNRAYIGKGDGSDGMGLESFTIAELGIAPQGNLLAFKDYNHYQVVGVFGAPDFTIQQAQSDMGCIAPRSLQFLSGYGIGRMTHLGFAITDGVRDKLMSEPIRPFIFGSPGVGESGLPAITAINSTYRNLIKATQATNPPMYVMAVPVTGTNPGPALSRLMYYDLVMKSWLIVDLPVSTSPTSYAGAIYQMRASEQPPLTILGGYDSGALQVIQNGDTQWHLGPAAADVLWAFTTPLVFNPQAPTGDIYLRALHITGVNRDAKAISVTLCLQTESGYVAESRVYPIGNTEFDIFIGVHETAVSAYAIISGSGRVEIESIMWEIEALETSGPVTLT